jgi:hypothetical protein
MKKVFLLLLILITIGCKEYPENNIQYLNGYWEIEKVILSTGEEHTYTYNEYVDYFKISDSLRGYRKKLKPSLKGAFETSKDSEAFVLKIENDSLNIYYKTSFSNWKETILSLTENHLKIINNQKNIYFYKPYQPININ